MSSEWREQRKALLLELVRHRGKVVGLVLGFCFGVLVLVFGFIKTLFVGLCLWGGYHLGSKVDNKEDLRRLLDRFFPK